jgi:hypothetical protein
MTTTKNNKHETEGNEVKGGHGDEIEGAKRVSRVTTLLRYERRGGIDPM